ncbi:uncharacterized protein zgc:193811 [Megalops cyprinoides]|uniref:uncharacterized protein zgc:193811 n=1 Tax=Megalops cyprinoides TaxID=118141 RepID=UPI001864C3B5|nr:uncharacterized protein zgc:193811 [Megalops cyprinoides]
MEVSEKPRRDPMHTSTGVAHIYRPPVPYRAESRLSAALPPLLHRPSIIPPTRHFSTSSGEEHDSKLLTGPLPHPLYSKAAPHWAINFIDEMADRLRHCPSMRMLTQPVSETQDCYRGLSAPEGRAAEHYNPLQALYRQLDTDKVPTANVPCISTARGDYRYFSRSELSPLGSLDTTSTHGNYPHTIGGAYSHIPPHKFQPTMSYQACLLHPLLPVPHNSKTSLYRDSYTIPASSLTATVPADVPDWNKAKAGRGLIGHILKVPKMYNTESGRYGGNKVVLV